MTLSSFIINYRPRSVILTSYSSHTVVIASQASHLIWNPVTLERVASFILIHNTQCYSTLYLFSSSLMILWSFVVSYRSRNVSFSSLVLNMHTRYCIDIGDEILSELSRLQYIRLLHKVYLSKMVVAWSNRATYKPLASPTFFIQWRLLLQQWRIRAHQTRSTLAYTHGRFHNDKRGRHVLLSYRDDERKNKFRNCCRRSMSFHSGR